MGFYDTYDYYDYGYADYGDLGTGEADFIGAFLGIYLVVLFIALAASAVVYVLQSLGIYKMSKTLGLSNPWLAWVPVCNLFAIGRLAECSNLYYGKKKGNMRVLLPLLSVLLLVPYIGMVVFVVFMALSGMAEDFSMIAGVLLFALAVLAIAVTLCVLQYVALYRIYKLFDPNNATLYTVLSVFFNIATSILLFILRDRLPGGGKPQPVPVYGQPPYNGYVPPVPPQPPVAGTPYYAPPAPPAPYPAPPAQPGYAAPVQEPAIDPAVQNTYMPPQDPTE